jgi:hypothetical protein
MRTSHPFHNIHNIHKDVLPPSSVIRVSTTPLQSLYNAHLREPANSGLNVHVMCGGEYRCHDAAANANMGRSMNLRFNSAALQLLQFCQTLGLLAQYIAFGEPFHLITDKFGFLVPDYNMLMMDCLVVSSVHMRYVFRMMWPLLVMLALWLLDHGVLARCWKRYKPSAFHEICVRIMNMRWVPHVHTRALTRCRCAAHETAAHAAGESVLDAQLHLYRARRGVGFLLLQAAERACGPRVESAGAAGRAVLRLGTSNSASPARL